METRSNYVMVGAVTVALLAGVLLFIVWLAGLSNKQTKCYDIYFAQAVGGLNKGSNVTFSGVPVGQVEQDLAASQPARIRVGADRRRRANPDASGHHRADQGRRLHRGQRNPARRRGRGAPPITQIGPQGCPVHPRDLGRARRAAQQRAGADRPHPAPDRAADRAAQRQEPEFDRRHPREYRRDHKVLRRARARPCATRSRDARIAVAQCRIAAQQHRGADRQHQPAGQRAGPAGGEDLRQGDCLGRSRRPTISTR